MENALLKYTDDELVGKPVLETWRNSKRKYIDTIKEVKNNVIYTNCWDTEYCRNTGICLSSKNMNSLQLLKLTENGNYENEV